MRYALAPHIRCAFHQGDAVFADLAHDTYCCLPRRHADPLRAALSGARTATEDPALEALIEAGFLVPAVEDDITALPTEAPACEEAMTPSARGDGRARDYMRLVAAAGRAIFLLRRRPPLFWLARYRRGATASACERARAMAIATRYARLATVLPFAHRCLPSALILAEWLRAEGIPPTLVFAVRTHSFAAHCWLQLDGLVLTDSIDHIDRYTPIAWS